MQIDYIQNLIDDKLQPNVAEWTMNVEDVLSEADMLTDDIEKLLKSIKRCNSNWHKSFPEQSDEIVAILKRVIKKIKQSSDNNIQGDTVVMTKNNVFIIYSHQHPDMMHEIKDFIREELGFEPKTLNIAECTGSVWDAFSEKSEACQKAVVLMAEDDFVKDVNGNEYKQARPNVFIELGYMIHKCGLKNVTIVRSKDCNIPSDVNGLTSVQYKAEKWTESLRKQLNR